jgi:hypothetical protein
MLTCYIFYILSIIILPALSLQSIFVGVSIRQLYKVIYEHECIVNQSLQINTQLPCVNQNRYIHLLHLNH